MDRPDISFIRSKPKICLWLFVTGGMLCVLLDIIGVSSISTESLMHSTINFPLPVYIMLPLTYIIAGVLIGVFSKNTYDAVIYGASIGQCQFLLPLIMYYCFIHNGTYFDIWWRALCGIVLAASFSGAAFEIKKLVKSK